MKYHHLIEDDAGVSRFADGEIALELKDFAPPAPPLYLSAFEPAAQLAFLILPPGWQGASHPSPARQVALCLAGTLLVEAGDGTCREIRTGDIWRMEDTQGAGHETHVIGEEEVRLAMVQLA